jgi:N-methylhydantoinase A
VATPLPGGRYGADSLSEFIARFTAQYAALYGHAEAQSEVEAVNWRLRATATAKEANSIASALAARRPPEGKARKGSRAIYIPERQAFMDVPVFDRYALRPGDRYAGPAVVEERESTVIVGTDATFEIDEYYTLRMELSYAR